MVHEWKGTGGNEASLDAYKRRDRRGKKRFENETVDDEGEEYRATEHCNFLDIHDE